MLLDFKFAKKNRFFTFVLITIILLAIDVKKCNDVHFKNLQVSFLHLVE